MNKQSSNKLEVCGIVISIIALLICLLTIGLWIFEVAPKSIVTIDAYMGVCATVLSVIVTIAIGWQIFNVVEVRGVIKMYAIKQLEIEELQKQLNEQLHQMKEDTDDLKHNSLHLHGMTLAIQSELKKDYVEACFHCMEVLLQCVQMKDPINIGKIFWYFQEYLNQINEPVLVRNELVEDLKVINSTIRASENYVWIANDYNKLVSSYISKLIVKQ